MWSELQNPGAMMGVQPSGGVQHGKRKLESDEAAAVLAASKLARFGPDPDDDLDDDYDEDEDEDEDDDDKAARYLPAGRVFQCARYPPSSGTSSYFEPYSSYRAGPPVPTPPPPPPPPPPHRYWAETDYYSDSSSSQQTIRCEENGKSYLDLGSSSARYTPPPPPPQPTPAPPISQSLNEGKCCDGSRTSWCRQGCYRQRRLAVLNISMCKLGRYRQYPDPSLHRSVLICNTLRYIEREMEQEGFFCHGGSTTSSSSSAAAAVAPAPIVAAAPPPMHAVTPAPSLAEPEHGYAYPAPVHQYPTYEHSLREMTQSGRATPFPTTTTTTMVAVSPSTDTDSGVGDDEATRGINWGSVLSLSSQSDLDPLNNNELLGEVDLAHELDELLPSWKIAPMSAVDLLKTPTATTIASESSGEVDNLMHVLVGT